MKLNFRKVIFSVTLFLVICAIGIGFSLSGGPKHQRKIRFDSKRVQIINELSRRIGWHYKEHKKLPEDLSELPAIKNDIYSYLDPETKAAPDYTKISDEKFELCMTFSTSNISDKNKKNYANYHYNYKKIMHKAGYHCAAYYKNPEEYGSNTFKLID